MSGAAGLHVLSHPIVNTRLASLRQTKATAREFREVSLAEHADLPVVLRHWH
jgi:uracil phosphoribosyltransferase